MSSWFSVIARYCRIAAFSLSHTSVVCPGLQADLLRPLAGCKDFGLEVEPFVRQGAERVGGFEVDKVFRGLRGDQLRLGRRTPAIRLRPEILNLVQRSLGTKESRHIVWQPARRPAVDHAMSLVAPGVCDRRMNGNESKPSNDQGSAKKT